MKAAGRLALIPFPFTDLSGTKLRPVLILRLSRLAVVDGGLGDNRLRTIRARLAEWLVAEG